jgi:hypothetical protein
MPSFLAGLWTKYSVHLSILVVASALTFIGVKSVPGAVFTTAYTVTQMQAHDVVRDSAIELFHRTLTARIDSTNKRVDLDSELLRAMARKECAELGRQKAESYGFPCRETTFHLPN